MSDIFVALRLGVILDQLPIAVFLMSEIYYSDRPTGVVRTSVLKTIALTITRNQKIRLYLCVIPNLKSKKILG